MDFDFKSNIEDESVNDSQSHLLLLIIGIAALFIFPSIALSILAILFSTVDIELLSYFAYFIGYGFYLWLLYFLLKKDKISKILKGFNKNNLIVAFIFAIILYLSSTMVTYLVNLIFGNVDSNANQESLDQGMLKYPIIVSIFSVVFAPIVEEFVFRFTIFRPIAQKNKILAYIISVLSFAGIHFISSLSMLLTDMANPELTNEIALNNFFNDLKTLPIYIVAAFVLTLSYDLNKNIATNILIHALYNLSQVVLMLLFANIMNGTEQDISSISSLSYIFKNILLIIR